jgi:hypothetical protein
LRWHQLRWHPPRWAVAFGRDVLSSARPSSTSDGGCRRNYAPRRRLLPQLPTIFHRPHWWPTLSPSTLALLADEVPTQHMHVMGVAPPSLGSDSIVRAPLLPNLSLTSTLLHS